MWLFHWVFPIMKERSLKLRPKSMFFSSFGCRIRDKKTYTFSFRILKLCKFLISTRCRWSKTKARSSINLRPLKHKSMIRIWLQWNVCQENTCVVTKFNSQRWASHCSCFVGRLRLSNQSLLKLSSGSFNGWDFWKITSSK